MFVKPPRSLRISKKKNSSITSSAMDSKSSEVAQDFSPFLRIYKDGRVERLKGTEILPPSTDSNTGVDSKDVVISPETGVSARLYLPKITNPDKKFPLLIYFHGGGFCIESAFSPLYHHYLTSLVAEANVVVISVNYRLAPEHPIPAAHEDSWTALKWAAAHHGGDGPENWLNLHADYNRMFLAGDSAGANIAHHMALKAGLEDLGGGGVKLVGTVLLHPYFWGTEPIGAETADAAARGKLDGLWRFANPATSGSDDPIINPAFDSDLGRLGGRKILVCVAEKDMLKERGLYYCKVLKKSGYGGDVEAMEAEGEEHVFHLFNPSCENAVALLRRMVAFFNEPKAKH